MDKPHFAFVPTQLDKPAPNPEPHCPTCLSGLDPTIREEQFEKVLKGD